MCCIYFRGGFPCMREFNFILCEVGLAGVSFYMCVCYLV